MRYEGKRQAVNDWFGECPMHDTYAGMGVLTME